MHREGEGTVLFWLRRSAPLSGGALVVTAAFGWHVLVAGQDDEPMVFEPQPELAETFTPSPTTPAAVPRVQAALVLEPSAEVVPAEAGAEGAAAPVAFATPVAPTPPAEAVVAAGQPGTGASGASVSSEPGTRAPLPPTAPARPPVAPAAIASQPRRAGATYVVARGDTLGTIATRHGVSVESVRLANNLPANSILQVGQPLLVPDVQIAGGVQSVSAITPPVQSRPTAQPTPAATPSATAVAATSPFAWPLRGNVTRRFGEKGSAGIDLTASAGAVVRAAASGLVVAVERQSDRLGWRVIVEHGAGATGLYANLATLALKKDDRIVRGQTIGALGKSGQPSLHFELRINGRLVDPLKLLPPAPR